MSFIVCLCFEVRLAVSGLIALSEPALEIAVAAIRSLAHEMAIVDAVDAVAVSVEGPCGPAAFIADHVLALLMA